MFRRPITLLARTMTTTATPPTRHLFFVWAPDKTEEGTLARRLEVRGQHLESAKERIGRGFIRTCGYIYAQYDELMAYIFPRYWWNGHDPRSPYKPGSSQEDGGIIVHLSGRVHRPVCSIQVAHR